MKKIATLLYILFIALTFSPCSYAQQIVTEDEHDHWNQTDSVQKTDVPVGLSVWTIEKRFASITPAIPDTVQFMFQNDNFTNGRSGEYNFLGNLGSPRINRLISGRDFSQNDSPFIFANPYDFFLLDTKEIQWTNTKSPIANITYNSCGNKQNGEDRIKALFATNAGKKLGMGFILDYLYGRGYYPSQSTAHFGGTLYASYRGDRYNLHTHYTGHHLKMAENGGIEDDSYIKQPELYPQKYGTADMPMRLNKTWNKLYTNTFYLSHHFNLGKLPQKKSKNKAKNDSISQVNDSLLLTEENVEEKPIHKEFVPVARILHTLNVDFNKRQFLSNLSQNANNTKYFADFYLPGDSASDRSHYINVENTLAFELCEGFNPWMKAGLSLFAKHTYSKYRFLNLHNPTQSYGENYLNIGAKISKRQGNIFHFYALGEYRMSGKVWGEFNAEGNINFNIPTKRDSIHLFASARIHNERPNFYFRHYHARNAWWDNEDLKNQFGLNATFNANYKGTTAYVTYQNLQNYTYLAEKLLATNNTSIPYLYGVGVLQERSNISLIGVGVRQHLRFGIFNWDIEGAYQLSSNKTAIPVPMFNGYTNLYLKFKIAKVLNTEIGADIRYFTPYYAPAYSPIIGNYVTQAEEHRQKIGNYPIMNAYANFHLKHTRFYVMASHFNHKLGVGNPFLVPDYPLNRCVFRFGISWNFFN
jgi:hypothetical protein